MTDKGQTSNERSLDDEIWFSEEEDDLSTDDIGLEGGMFPFEVDEPESIAMQLRREAREIRQLWELEEPEPSLEEPYSAKPDGDDFGVPDHDRTMEIRQAAARLIAATEVREHPPLDPEIIAFAERALSG